MDTPTIVKTGGGASARGVVLQLVGATLVVCGGVLLLGVGLTVLDILANPADVKIVALILDEMHREGDALYGDLDGARFAIGIGEPLRTVVFLVLVLWLLGVLVSILKTLVLTGKELITAARTGDDA